MSKIIEALRRQPSTPSTPSSVRSAETKLETREIRVESSHREWTQERLADVYFSAVGKPKTTELPVIIKIVEKPRLAAAMPWIITSIAFLITATALFSTKRLLVDVRVIDDKTLMHSFDDEMTFRESASESQVAGDNETESSQPLSIAGFSFEGAAILQSSKDPRRLTLVNSSVSPFARAILRLDKNVDMSHSKLVFEARGARGGENIAVAIKDTGNVQAFKKGSLKPFPQGLSSQWQQAEILLVDINESFDPKNISSIRFEFGAKDTDNHSGDILYVRNLRLVDLG